LFNFDAFRGSSPSRIMTAAYLIVLLPIILPGGWRCQLCHVTWLTPQSSVDC